MWLWEIASTIRGVSAPFEEEDTKEVMHLQKLSDAMDLFGYWLQHANSDLVSGRKPEPRLLGPSES